MIGTDAVAKSPAFCARHKSLSDALNAIKATRSGVNLITAGKVMDLVQAQPGKVTMAIPCAGSVGVEL